MMWQQQGMQDLQVRLHSRGDGVHEDYVSGDKGVEICQSVMK
jgi:hypothetical protein